MSRLLGRDQDGELLSVGIGCDLVSVAEVERALERYGQRYRSRIFSQRELAEGGESMRAERVAARFAAKEAVLKALGPVEPGINLREIEILVKRGGGCGVGLSGKALELARREGLESWSVSLCHEGGTAVAVVVAGRWGARGCVP